MPSIGPKTPSVSARSFAELLVLPAFQHVRILNEQKYPRQTPNVFRLPFYAPALTAIRNFYKSGNSASILRSAAAEASVIRPPSKGQHNVRVLKLFSGGAQAARTLSVRRLEPLQAKAGHGVTVRLNFDLVAHENGQERYIFYNFRDQPVGEELARYSLEIATWALLANGKRIKARALEYVDLAGGVVHYSKPLRARTEKAIEQNARVVGAVWSAL